MDYSFLRENDIRGVFGTQINEEVALVVGKAFGTYLLSKSIVRCVVGHDNRTSSESLTNSLISGILSTGVSVKDIGLCTTPMFNYGSIILNIPYGIMVTASHNPATDNGFKIFGENFLHLEHEELAKFYDLIRNRTTKTGIGLKGEANVKDKYIEMLLQKANLGNKKLKVVIDTGNGTPSILVRDIFDKLNIDVNYLNAISDGTFPVHNPDPNVPENLVMLKEKVLELSADVGIAFDGDGDRLGIVDDTGVMVPTDTLMAIFAADILPNADNKQMILDVKCSKALDSEIRRLGGEPIMVKNGSAYIETLIAKMNILFGGEYSGHVFFRDKYYGYDDGIYAGIRLLEILSKTQKKCSNLYEHLEKYVNTPEIKVYVDDEKKWEIVEKVKEYAINKNYNVNSIDGVRVDYEDGFSLIRSSNTGAYLTLRFEAKDENTLDLRRREYLNLVNFLIK